MAYRVGLQGVGAGEGGVQADGAVHLGAREGGGAEDVVEVGVGQCQMRHTAGAAPLPQGPLGRAAQQGALAQGGARVDQQRPGRAHGQPGRRVPAGQPQPPDAGGHPLPALLRPGSVRVHRLITAPASQASRGIPGGTG